MYSENCKGTFFVGAKYFFYILFILIYIIISVSYGLAGEPTEKIKETTDKILKIVSDKELKQQKNAAKRKDMISKAVDERFDWEEMSSRSLARHWRARTEDEKKKFIPLFSKLLERTYLNKLEGYSGEEVEYLGENIDDEYAVVQVRISTLDKKEIDVDYRMKKKDMEWFVYDISIAGVSLINNYRKQFNSIILRSSYDKLIKKLEDKVAGE